MNYPSFTVAGIYHGGTALEAGAVIMPLDQLQQFSSLQGKVTAYHLRLRPPPAGEARDKYVKRAQPQTASIVSASVSPLHLLQALGISLLSGLAADAVPAGRGAHLSPVEALRHD